MSEANEKPSHGEPMPEVIHLQYPMATCCICGKDDLSRWGVPIDTETALICANDYVPLRARIAWALRLVCMHTALVIPVIFAFTVGGWWTPASFAIAASWVLWELNNYSRWWNGLPLGVRQAIKDRERLSR